MWKMGRYDSEMVDNVFKHIFGLVGIPRWLSFGVLFFFVVWQSDSLGFVGHAQFEEIAFVLMFANCC